MEELSRKALPQEAGEERPETGFSGDRSRELLGKVWNPDTYPEGGEEENTLSLLYELWADMRSIENTYDPYALEAYYAISARLLCQSRRLGLQRELPFGTGILNPAAPSVTTDWQELFGYLILLSEEIVYQKKHAGNIEPQNAGKQTADVIEQVKSYIREHLGEDTSLQFLAQQVHFSQEYLLRLFKKKEGITILQYINALKLSAARQLLTDTKLPIKEIARQLGFSSPGYFGRFFRKKTGLTPNAWRECNSTKNQED